MSSTRKILIEVIGGHKYKTHQLGALQGREVLIRFVNALKKGGIENSVEDFNFFCDSFAPVTYVQLGDKEPVLSSIFDAHFVGLYDEMIEWIKFCLKANFPSFFQTSKSESVPSPDDATL
jgi:hypothetical protein